jgi:hypothetical protein
MPFIAANGRIWLTEPRAFPLGKIQKVADLHVDNFLGLPKTSNGAIEGWVVASLD